ncbi:hypothetical protein FQR65_LT02939 [Abscondita terminalis]|nr:hypothetical protein FQR65_LT02939 [Abscondita terminalis]
MSIMDVISDNASKNLKEIPENVMAMANLKMLYLEDNEIEEIPNDFFVRLSKLTWLDLRKNKLTTIPSNIAEHQCLETILLQNNRIEYLPTELGVVPKLKVLQISGNPIIYPPKEILNQGILTVCSFLKTEHEKLEKDKSEDETESIPSPDSCSVVTKDDDTHNLDPSIKPKESNAFVPILVKQLSNTKSVSTSHFKRTHKITRGCSKISLRSHSSWHNKRKNERVQDCAIKDVWLKRLTDLLSDQEKILQQEKNLRSLNKWRLKSKLEAPRQVSLEDLPQAPYDVDPDYNKMFSRKDLTETVDTMIEKSKRRRGGVK